MFLFYIQSTCHPYPVVNMHLYIHNFFIIRHDDVKTIRSKAADIFIYQ